MELSLSMSYFLNQIKNNNDKDFFINYYENFQIHLEHVKKYIEIKKSLQFKIKEFINRLKMQLEDIYYLKNINTRYATDKILSQINQEILLYETLYIDITNSLYTIEIDARNYKENFKKNLFYLIKK